MAFFFGNAASTVAGTIARNCSRSSANSLYRLSNLLSAASARAMRHTPPHDPQAEILPVLEPNLVDGVCRFDAVGRLVRDAERAPLTKRTHRPCLLEDAAPVDDAVIDDDDAASGDKVDADERDADDADDEVFIDDDRFRASERISASGIDMHRFSILSCTDTDTDTDTDNHLTEGRLANPRKCVILDSAIIAIFCHRLELRFIMGGDGGSIPKRADLVHERKRREEVRCCRA
jgi:hypothetical protein